MATRLTAEQKAAAAELEAVDRESALVEFSPEELENMSSLDRLRAQLGGSSGTVFRIIVYRQNKLTKKLDQCFECTQEEFENMGMEYIREKWGPGEYEFRVFSDGRLRHKAVQSLAAPLGAPVVAPALQQDGSLQTLITMLAEGQNRILEALTKQPDPDASRRALLQDMALMREAMGMTNNPAPPQKDSVTMLTEMMSAMRTMKEMGREFNAPDAPEESETSQLIKLATPLVAPLLASFQKGGSDSGTVQPIVIPHSLTAPKAALPPNEAAENTQQTQNPTLTADQQMDLEIMRGSVLGFVKLARDPTKTPEDGADYIDDYIPPDLLEYLSADNWFEILTSFVPEVKPHEKWLRDSVATFLARPEDDDEHLPPK